MQNKIINQLDYIEILNKKESFFKIGIKKIRLEGNISVLSTRFVSIDINHKRKILLIIKK